MATMTCAHCEAAPATRFVEERASYDPCCEDCFADRYAVCRACGAAVPAEELDEDDECEACAPPRPDADEAYERWLALREE